MNIRRIIGIILIIASSWRLGQLYERYYNPTGCYDYCLELNRDGTINLISWDVEYKHIKFEDLGKTIERDNL